MKNGKHVYLIQSKSTNGCAKHWRNAGLEYFDNPDRACKEMQKMGAQIPDSENANKLFRIAKFEFVESMVSMKNGKLYA